MPDWVKCPACRGKKDMFDSRHTRDPATCMRAMIEPKDWTCPACKAYKPRDNAEHTYGPDC
eukprot:4491555-Pyramimonas_sp.AAC.2